jgi:hypothetical protein
VGKWGNEFWTVLIIRMQENDDIVTSRECVSKTGFLVGSVSAVPWMDKASEA